MYDRLPICSHDCGHFCFGVDGKYDLNNKKAPVLAIVIEDLAGYGSPLVFSLSDKENHYTIRMAVQAVKINIPCNDPTCMHCYQYTNLPNGMGFQHQPECISNWNPLAMMDKHWPTKLALQGLVCGAILCWFHIMATLGKHLKMWKVDCLLRYPIALVFKIVGRSRSDNKAAKMKKEYYEFIDSLPLDNNIKVHLKHDLKMNWICNEWRRSFIDRGRMPQMHDIANSKPITMNNLTERMHKTVEARNSGTQTVVKFIERLYVDKKRRINQRRFYVLLGLVLPIPEQENYMLVKKQSRRFYSPYNFHPIDLTTQISEKLNELIIKLCNRDNLNVPNTCYLVNTLSGECTCYDYIWNSPFRDVCKHVHAAQLYTEVLCENLQIQEIKERLVKHFKNKEYAVAPEKRIILFIMELVMKFIKKFCDFIVDWNLMLSEISINNIGNEEPYSIQRCNTTRIRNKCRSHMQTMHSNDQENEAATATKRLLEELFFEKECAWNPQEFTNIAVTKKLRLDNDPVENSVKLYRWISNRKIRAKKNKSN
ncbi:proteophosphoglycan ppg4 [Gigaspora margarita]|uniref:Proteophosphoglycan ppg4 n=1 Tax=Gigaspora margarita TaxID=4874 RepID=A0A8H4ERP0_GIGMA|nr:proteophosphoglycan ppg4 [Gigaspora margarita]